MPMSAGDIERLIKAALPDARISIRELPPTATITPRRLSPRSFAARAVCSSTRWCMRR